MRTIGALSMALVLCSVACGGTEETDVSEGNLQNTADLTFAADGSVRATGDLVEGGLLKVHYDAARLPGCRGDFQGRPGWTITGFASVGGAPAQTFDALDATKAVKLTGNGDLALWFQVTSRWGCSEYDSKLGANYHFTVQKRGSAPSASIVFDASGNPTQTGELKAGGKVKIHYAQDRLTTCRGSQGGYPQWSLTGYASLNGRAAKAFETTEATRDGNRSDTDAFVELSESGDLALWFQNTSRYGCNAYDSKGGANYHFVVR